MSRRTKVIGLLLLLATTAYVALIARRAREPDYKGKPLSFWAEGGYSDMLASRSQAPLTAEDFRHAILTIGTNAQPWLLKWIAYEPPHLPKFLVQALPVRLLTTTAGNSLMGLGPKDTRACAASYACSVLGTNA